MSEEGAPIEKAHSRQTNEEGGVGLASADDTKSGRESGVNAAEGEDKPGSSNDDAKEATDKYGKDPTGDPQGTAEGTDPTEPTGAGNDAPAKGEDEDGSYPEQRHAGKLGYGPNYKEHPTTGDKITGAKEIVKGKILRKPDVAEQGHQRMTGELAKKEQQEEDAEDPFSKDDDDKEETKASAGDEKDDE